MVQKLCRIYGLVPAAAVYKNTYIDDQNYSTKGTTTAAMVLVLTAEDILRQGLELGGFDRDRQRKVLEALILKILHKKSRDMVGKYQETAILAKRYIFFFS